MNSFAAIVLLGFAAHGFVAGTVGVPRILGVAISVKPWKGGGGINDAGANRTRRGEVSPFIGNKVVGPQGYAEQSAVSADPVVSAAWIVLVRVRVD